MTYLDKEDNNHIYVTRGDTLAFDIRVPLMSGGYRLFETDDSIRLGIYKKNKLHEPALVLENFIAGIESEVFRIIIDSNNMKLGKLDSKSEDFWYEIILNDKETIIGSKREEINGRLKDIPAILTVLPEGSDLKESENNEGTN